MSGSRMLSTSTYSSSYYSSSYSSVTPSEIKRVVSRLAPQFTGYGQHDSQEFLRFLL